VLKSTYQEISETSINQQSNVARPAVWSNWWHHVHWWHHVSRLPAGVLL